MKIYQDIFKSMVSVESLFAAWNEFKRGKQKKPDVARFELNLEKNIFALHRELDTGVYKHGVYSGFYVQDPKLRHIHKAEVRDRIVHQIIYSELTKIYEPTFINDSYSCRINKGTHRAIKAFENMARKVSQNHTSACYVLKCDIRKFFDSVDHEILLKILARRIKDDSALQLFREVIGSFAGYKDYVRESAGIPIGNLTSQIFANIYLNELDQFVKHVLREKYYERYADDFIFLSSDKSYLEALIAKVEDFLREKLQMELHPKKVELRNFYQGVDFLGYIVFPKHKILRTKTKRRMLKKMDINFMDFMKGKIEFSKINQVFQSYFGIMGHGNCRKLENEIREEYCLYLKSEEKG